MGRWSDGDLPGPHWVSDTEAGAYLSLCAGLLRPDCAHFWRLHHHHHLQVRPLCPSVGEEWSGAA